MEQGDPERAGVFIRDRLSTLGQDGLVCFRIWDACEIEKLIYLWPFASDSIQANGLCLLIEH